MKTLSWVYPGNNLRRNKLSEVEESKITAEHRAMIGIKSDPIEVTPKAEDASRMRDLLGDKDPRYLSLIHI